jgi:hypothetical protein
MSISFDVPPAIRAIISQYYTALSSISPYVLLLSVVWLYFSGSFFFDVVHYLLHRCSKSTYRFIRKISDIHQVHHLYFNRRLEFNYKYHWHNLFVEIPLELMCQFIGSVLAWLIVRALGGNGVGKLPREALDVVLLVQAVRVLVVMAEQGHDSNHISYATVPKDPNWIIVGPEYHALHHVHPECYMGSAFRIFDWGMGLNSALPSKRVTITGATGAFGRAIKKELQREGVICIQELKFGQDWSYDNYDKAIPTLANTDVLILAHGSKGPDALHANCHSAIALIDLFRQHRKSRPGFTLSIPEIWYTGSESELHLSWGIPKMERYSHSKRAFLPTARRLYDDPAIQYRHLVLAAFQSPMGKAIVSADWSAKVAMWWIRRGARYVPVTYTGMAYLNMLKFMFWVRPEGKAKVV